MSRYKVADLISEIKDMSNSIDYVNDLYLNPDVESLIRNCNRNEKEQIMNALKNRDENGTTEFQAFIALNLLN